MAFIIQILGPTGVGKSSCAIKLAREINGEIVSADSMQVYRGFDIGTDKLKIGDRQGVPHYLIDIFTEGHQFSAHHFLEKSYAAVSAIIERGCVPIVCGGTALYLKIMKEGMFPESGRKRVTRDRLESFARQHGLQSLWKKIQRIDPEYAVKIGSNDRIRIIRGLEIYYNNGLPPSVIFKRSDTPFRDFRFLRVGLILPRDQLYRRIEKRVDRMIQSGLREEVEALLIRYPRTAHPFKSVGYKEMMMVVEGRIPLSQGIDLMKQRSRNFAKRQLTWFRREKDIHWFDPGDTDRIIDFVLKDVNITPKGATTEMTR